LLLSGRGRAAAPGLGGLGGCCRCGRGIGSPAMTLSLLLAALLAQTGPRESFIVCPGHPRCPRSPSAQHEQAPPRISGSRGFSLARRPARPPPQPGIGANRIVYFAVNATALDAPARQV